MNVTKRRKGGICHGFEKSKFRSRFKINLWQKIFKSKGGKTQRGRKEKEENTEKSFVIGGFLLNTAQGTQAAPMTAVELSA